MHWWFSLAIQTLLRCWSIRNAIVETHCHRSWRLLRGVWSEILLRGVWSERLLCLGSCNLSLEDHIFCDLSSSVLRVLRPSRTAWRLHSCEIEAAYQIFEDRGSWEECWSFVLKNAGHYCMEHGCYCMRWRLLLRALINFVDVWIMKTALIHLHGAMLWAWSCDHCMRRLLIETQPLSNHMTVRGMLNIATLLWMCWLSWRKKVIALKNRTENWGVEACPHSCSVTSYPVRLGLRSLYCDLKSSRKLLL